MERISMNEAVGDETVHLSPPDGGRIENQVINYLLVGHSTNRYQGGNNNNDQGDRHFHGLKINGFGEMKKYK